MRTLTLRLIALPIFSDRVKLWLWWLTRCAIPMAWGRWRYRKHVVCAAADANRIFCRVAEPTPASAFYQHIPFKELRAR